MSIFFTSDTHFGAERTFELSRRPFKNIKQMDRYIIKNWNKTIKNNDVVYHLGDFGNKQIIKKLNGNVILIFGNYEEKEIRNNFNNNFQKYKDYLKKLGFYDVIRHDLTITIQNKQYYLTHKPIDCKKDMFNLFGHIHGKQSLKRFGIDVGVDANFFYPFSVDDILFWKNSVKIHLSGKNVFCDIDDLK